MDPPTIGYQPALDGVRAVAVTTVVLFHAGVSWMGGGYLGVSVFFTLSGFLITRLLVAEQDRAGSVSLPNFFARRARRLLPASLLCLAAVVVAARLGAFPGVTDLRRDVLGALFQVANWVSLSSGGSYADLLDASAGVVSPIEHYWSLAIEEQFYWLWPLAFVGIGVVATSRGARRAGVLAVTVLACVSAPVIATMWGPDAAYWATPARAGEILLGASLAVVLAERDRAGRSLPARTAALAPVGLAVVLTCSVVFPPGSGPAYAGALPLFALASVALLLGLQAPGRTRRVLSAAPLVGLGRISYGVYLYHWPLFVALDERRTGLEGPSLLALRLAATLAAALASFRLVEQPLRTGTRFTPRPTAIIAVSATLAVGVVALVVLPTQTADYWRLDQAALDAAAPQRVDQPLAPLVPIGAPSPVTTPPPADRPTAGTPGQGAPEATGTDRTGTDTAGDTPDTDTPDTDTPDTDTPDSIVSGPVPELDPGFVLPRPVRALVVGDSIAESLGTGMVGWALEEPDVVSVSLATTPGCGFLRTGEYRVGDAWTTVPASCDRLLDERLPEALDTLRPDVVLLTATSWDLNERRWAAGPSLFPDDEEYALRLVEAYDALTTLLLDRSDAVVMWLRHPLPNPFWLGRGTVQESPDNHQVLWDAMAHAAAKSPRAFVVDLAGWASEHGLDGDVTARPDGIHWSTGAASEIARRYVGPWAVRLAVAGP